MYTAEQQEDASWDILDSDGDWLFTVATEGEKDAALSHLNRNL